MRQTAGSTVVVLLLAVLVHAQGAPSGPLTLISREPRRAVPTATIGGQELIALDDVALIFQVGLKEDALAGGMTVSYRGRAIVVSANQAIASVDGRVVALPSAVVRDGRRWLVPLEFLPRVLGPIYDRRIELRRASRLLIIGDMRVPRVTARLDQVGPSTRVTIDVTPPAPVTVSTEAGRVLVRIDADALDLALPSAGAGLVDQIRVGDSPLTVAVVPGPRAGVPRAASTASGSAAIITVDVPPAAAPSTAAAPAPATPPREAPPPLALRRPALGTVVLDPGHGGDDMGARGARGVEEKRITLDIVRRLRTQLETRLGLRVIQTREDDQAVTLDARAAVANNNKADLFLSLHVNTAPSGGLAGAEVFTARLDGEGEAARRAADAVTLPVLGGLSRRIDVIRWDLAQAAHVDASAILATIMAAELQGRVPMGPRPLQQGPIRVLMGANMPAALVEVAYVSNAEQEQVVASDGFQDAVAQALFDAIVRFGDYLQERQVR